MEKPSSRAARIHSVDAVRTRDDGAARRRRVTTTGARRGWRTTSAARTPVTVETAVDAAARRLADPLEPSAGLEQAQAVAVAGVGHRRGEAARRGGAATRPAPADGDRAVRAPVDRARRGAGRMSSVACAARCGSRWPVPSVGPQPAIGSRATSIDAEVGHPVEEVGVAGEVHRPVRRTQHVADGRGADPAVRSASCRVDGRDGLDGHRAEANVRRRLASRRRR